MDQLLWGRIGELFAEVRELSGESRLAFLKERCGKDQELLQQVMSLLQADDKSGLLDSSPTISAFPVPQVVAGRFRIIRYIAEGGMGTVYEAEDLTLGDRVALKTIRQDIVSNPRAIERFKREISLGKRVTHPNVCRIHDLGVGRSEDGPEFLFLTMQFLSGETLASRIKRGPIPTREALSLVEDMTAALSAAHQAGVIHRDFKSGNVMLVNDSSRVYAVVTDFGLARQVHDKVSLTQTGMVGTVSYMAPEQIKGEELTPAADIYALGVVMFEMVTGELPFKGDSNITVALKHLNEEPKPPRELRPDLEPCWQEAILGCLRKAPEERFPSAEEVRAALDGRKPRNLVGRKQLAGSRSAYLMVVAGIVVVFFLSLAIVNPALRERLRAELHWNGAAEVATSFAERDRVLLTDFENQTNDPSFDRTVRDLLGQALSQSSYVNVVPRLTAMEAAERTGALDPTRIDANLGRQICIRENYRAMLTGSVRPANSGFRIDTQVEDPRNDQVLAADSETIHSPDQLYDALDRLALRLRRRLGESLKGLAHENKPLAEVTTPSLEALRRYSQAVDLFGNHENSRSIRLATDAVTLDPHFAMAHLLLARNYDYMGNDTGSREQFRLARAELSHASEREQHLIVASDYFSQEKMEEAAEEYQHLLDLYPDDVDSLRGFSESAYWSGRIDDAVTAERKALALSPNNVADYAQLMTLLTRAGKFDQALSVLAESRAHGFDTLQTQFVGAVAAWGNGDLETPQSTFSRLIATNDEYWRLVGYLWAGKLLAFQGRMAEATQSFNSGLVLVQQPERSDWVAVYQYMLARTAIIAEDKNRARSEAAKLVAAAESDPAPENLQRAGRLAIETGALKSAKSLKAILQRQVASRNNLFADMHFFTLQGDLDLAYHRSDLAVQDVRRALAFRQGFEPYLVLGQACEQRRDWHCAIDSYKNFLSFKGSILRDDYPADWVVANYYLARTYVSAGQVDEGLKQYDIFLRLFSSADKNVPVVLRAKDDATKLRTKPATLYVQ